MKLLQGFSFFTCLVVKLQEIGLRLSSVAFVINICKKLINRLWEQKGLESP